MNTISDGLVFEALAYLSDGHALEVTLICAMVFACLLVLVDAWFDRG